MKEWQGNNLGNTDGNVDPLLAPAECVESGFAAAPWMLGLWCRSVMIRCHGKGAIVDLVHELTFQVSRGESFPVGAGPFGRRVVAAVGGGWVKGDRINGAIVGPSADWAVLGGDGYYQIDVRAQIRTDDGAVLLLTYTGSLELNQAVMAALADGETRFEDQYFRTHVRMESGDERYRWVNRTLFVGMGRITPGGVVYDVSRVT